MKHTTCSCGSPKKTRAAVPEPMEIPEQIQKELDAIGGLEALAGRIPPQEELEKRSRIHQALSDPIRLRILHLIRDQPLCVCVINRFMGLPGPKLSYHLTILKESGLIEGNYHGNWIIYSLTDLGKKFV